MVKLIVKLVNLTVQYDYCKFGNFHEGFILRSFVKMKSSGNREITLSITDIVKSCPNSECFNVALSFNAIRENKILAKISGFTVC